MQIRARHIVFVTESFSVADGSVSMSFLAGSRACMCVFPTLIRPSVADSAVFSGFKFALLEMSKLNV